MARRGHRPRSRNDHAHPPSGRRAARWATLIELGKEEYHAELVHDDASHTATIYLLNAHAERATDDRYQTLSSYSKGMRQKILIAAAVLHNPRIVILDEPFSGLDVTAARVLKAFVRSLAAEGKMVVFSSHVLEVVEQVCSRVVILKDGRIVGHDSVDNLRNTLKLPSLDAVFATLVEEDNVDKRTSALIAAMHLQ